MAKPFDATLNALIDLRPDDWAQAFGRLAGIPPGVSTVLDTDLATTLQADKLFHIDGPKPSLLHLELEANPRLGVPRDLMRYNTLIGHRLGLPVETVLVLLRPKAQASDQTGVYRTVGVNGNLIAEFHYHVERVWERPVGYWFEKGIAMAPLAVATDDADRDLDGSLSRFIDFVRRPNADAAAINIALTSAYILAGLRHNREKIDKAFRGLHMLMELMEESTNYQAILEKGWNKGLDQGLTQGLRIALVEQGTERFGPPRDTATAALDGITDTARLRRLARRILHATDWDDLLATG